MRTVYILLALSSLVLSHPVLAGDYYRNPMTSVLQGQAIEEGLARAQQEGQAMREQEQGFSAPRPFQRMPRVTNPYSPYLGLPADVAEGLYFQQLQEMQQKIDQLERRQRR